MHNNEIRIIAPASGGIDSKSISNMQTKFEKLGFKINLPNDLLQEQLFCSNHDKYRSSHLIQELTDVKKNIIWALRGGYGSARIISTLYNIKKPKIEKIFIGFSDITALHLFLSQEWGWKTIHAPIAKNLVDKQYDPNNFKILLNLLSHKNYEVKIPIFEQLNNIKFNAIKGPLTGGNLALLQTSIGTQWQMKSAGKIVFIEEVNEEGYKVDRVLEHLLQAGLFKDVKAVVLGDFVDKNNQSTYTMMALIRFAKKVNFPVFKTNYFGHGYHNYPIVYNAEGEIQHSSDGLILKYHL